jgi:hypothetical protein
VTTYRYKQPVSFHSPENKGNMDDRGGGDEGM